jgi:hypothetical protein
LKLRLLIFTLILSLNFLLAKSRQEKGSPIFEQKALDFFRDSLLHKKEPFLKTRAYFGGQVDSRITTLGFSCVARKFYNGEIKDKALGQYLLMEDSATNEFYENNKREPFELEVKKPIRRNFIKPLAPKKTTSTIKIFQNRRIGDKNYVWFRLYSKDGWSGKDLYFIMDNEGQIIDWCYLGFIF